jgi:ppGpp synthetase/RelA/SpoT-type nucleotidyltranferase
MKPMKDMREIASILDETIEKAEAIKAREQAEIKKSLSFNPFTPVTMSPSSSRYYNPYRSLPDGSFAPHPVDHYQKQNPDKFNSDPTAYREVKDFYSAAGVAMKRSLMDEVDDIVKGVKLPIGTIHEWKGQQFKKIREGEWRPVTNDKSHPIEESASGHKAALEKELAARKKGKPEPRRLRQRESDADEREKTLTERGTEMDNKEHETRMRELDHRERELEKREAKVEQHKEKTKGEAKEKKTREADEKNKADAAKTLERKTKRRKPGAGGHVKLTADELKSVLKDGRYALISAGKNPEHAEDSKMTDAAVAKRHERLKSDLKKDGFMFTEVDGHYGGEEKSFLVMVHDADRNHISDMGSKFNQDSVIYSDKGSHQMIFTTGEDAGLHHSGSGFELTPDASDFYSEMTHPDGTSTKFSLNFDMSKKGGQGLRDAIKQAALGKEPDHEAPDDISPAEHPRGPQWTPLPGDMKVHNGLHPPPKANEKYVKPGKDVSVKDARDFIEHFEKGFKEVAGLESVLKEAGATHFAGRLKDEKSLAKKMNERKKSSSLNVQTDIIGARALAGGLHGQQAILDHIKKNHEIVELDDSTSKARPDGYRAIHALVKTSDGKIAEMQIKTHNQQIFSGFTHDHIYKGKPEVKKDKSINDYVVAVSQYLNDVDSGRIEHDMDKIPKAPPAMAKHGMEEFPWDEVTHGIGHATVYKAASGEMKYFVVQRHHKTKENMDVSEHSSFQEAKAHKKKLQAKGHKGEAVIGHGRSKKEFLDTFSEYRPKGPGSRGGKVVGYTKTGKTKYQKKR